MRLHFLTATIAIAFVLLACDHGSERESLLGYWEGEIPLPATGEPVPISYDFRDDGLTVSIGMGSEAIVQTWPQWQIVGEVRGSLLIEVLEGETRSYATFAREIEGGELLLWDRDTEESSGARVRRVEREPAPPPPTEEGTGEGSGQRG